MDIGTTLRTARQRQELSLEQLAATTKIPVGVLQAIERNDFEHVPRGIFARGFIRAYAREVGLDPEETVGQFLEETGDVISSMATMQAAEQAPADEEIDDRQFDPAASASGPGLGYVLIVAALLVAIISFNRSAASGGATATAAPPAPPPPAVGAETMTAALRPAAISTDELQAVATSGATLRFALEAQGPCWVEAVADGRKLVYRLMQPGEREIIDAEGEVVLRVGDPAALTYSVNGRPGEPLGQAGIPVTVRFNTAGERVELAS